MAHELQKRQDTLQSLIASPAINQRFKEVLRDKAPQFTSSLLQVGRSLGDDCEPMSIVAGAMQAAALDLPVSKSLGFAWLVPFKERDVKKAQFQIGYKGYIQLALRTGQYSRMNASPINAECLGGYDCVGEREVDWSKYDPEKEAAAYVFAFKMVNGFTKVAVWSKADVEAHAKKYSQSYRGGYNSPWKTNFDEMATKTVIANELRRWGIMSIELQKAFETDQGVIDVDASVRFVDSTTEQLDQQDRVRLEPPPSSSKTEPEISQQPEEQKPVERNPKQEPSKAKQAVPEQRVEPEQVSARVTRNRPEPPPMDAPAADVQTEPWSELANAMTGVPFDKFSNWSKDTGRVDLSYAKDYPDVTNDDALTLLSDPAGLAKCRTRFAM